MPKHKGSDVTIVRKLKEGDAGFNRDQDMVVIKGKDGKEQTVARNEVQD